MADNGDRNDTTPQEIWSMLRELTASQRETARLIRELRESGAETDRRMQETDRQMQETDRRLRKLDDLFNGQWGKLIEALVAGDLIRLLNRRDVAVQHLSTNLELNDAERTWEIDILAMNGAELVAVEVKTTLKVRDVDHFLDTLRHLTRLLPDYANREIYRRRRLPEGRRTRQHLCGAAGTVRDSRHRQQRQHHQPERLPAPHLRPQRSARRLIHAPVGPAVERREPGGDQRGRATSWSPSAAARMSPGRT